MSDQSAPSPHYVAFVLHFLKQYGCIPPNSQAAKAALDYAKANGLVNANGKVTSAGYDFVMDFRA